MTMFQLRICLGLLLLIAHSCEGQLKQPDAALKISVDQSTAVSFFYFGDMWSHWREPMNFYTVGPADPHLHKVQVDVGIQSKDGGWRTWVTQTEMRSLIKELATLDVSWQYTAKIEHFRPLQQREITDWMDVTVTSSRGTAKAYIRLTRMCDELQELDSTMPTPRILWQFQTLRWDDGCVVPGYHNEDIPKE